MQRSLRPRLRSLPRSADRNAAERRAGTGVENLRLALAAAGCAPADLLKINYYVVGLDHDRLLAVRAARDQFFPGDKPASTLVGVAALFDPDSLVEVELVAARPR